MVKETSIRAKFVVGTQFTVETSSAHTIQLDTPEYPGASSAGPSPMELLLTALAGCTGISILPILRKMRQDITAYTINVYGTQTEHYPQVFTRITVEHHFTGQALKESSIERAIALTEKHYCSVSAMLSKTAQITHTISINAEG